MNGQHNHHKGGKYIPQSLCPSLNLRSCGQISPKQKGAHAKPQKKRRTQIRCISCPVQAMLAIAHKSCGELQQARESHCLAKDESTRGGWRLKPKAWADQVLEK
jgi:hypothetical protein